MTIITENFDLESRRIENGISIDEFDLNDESLELDEGIVLENNTNDLPF